MEIYHSWWYISILLTFFLNVLICSLNRLPATFKLFKQKKIVPITKETIYSYPVKYVLNDSPDEKYTKILDNLKRKHYYIINKDNWIWAEKGKSRHWGSYLIHLGILLFIIGYMIGKLYGLLGTFIIYNDTDTDSYYNWYNKKDEFFDYKVRLENTEINYYPIDILIEIAEKNGKTREYTLREKENIDVIIGTEPYLIEFYQFIPDAMIRDNIVYEISKVKANICFAFKIYNKNNFELTNFIFKDNIYVNSTEKLGFKLLIKNFKIIEKEVKADLVFLDKKVKNNTLKREKLAINNPVNYKGITFYIVEYGQDDYRNINLGLQITNDPGLILVWISFILMISGAILSFFVYHKKILVLKEKNQIIIGGTCLKNRFIIEREIKKIL